MQNKPNLLAPKMNITTVITKDYENKRLCARRKNKPKTNPIKANQSQFQTQSNPIFKKSNIFNRFTQLFNRFRTFSIVFKRFLHELLSAEASAKADAHLVRKSALFP